MSVVTEISLMSLPGAEAEPEPVALQRRTQVVLSSDGRAAVTLVSWLSAAESADSSS